jgi:hypothetical protein
VGEAILASALFAGVNNNLGIFVIVRYNEFVFCKCKLYFGLIGFLFVSFN